ncbi:MAG: type IV pilus modification protein PilV, partial [Lautropia mirabilis]
MLNPVFSRTSRQGGSSLIEVLVAIIVLSVGMLSMLWAQTKSMGFERTAEFRNIAAQIASEYADRIRANLNVDKGVARGDRANAYLYTA